MGTGIACVYWCPGARGAPGNAAEKETDEAPGFVELTSMVRGGGEKGIH